MQKSNSMFVKCQCGGCSVLEIEYCPDDGPTNMFNVAVWQSHPGISSMPKKERTRWCEHVMKTGKPWADHTIVSKEDAMRLANFISKHTNPSKKNGKETKRH